MLEPLFESPIKENILLYILKAESAYALQIAKVFDYNVNAVRNQLINLERGGVLYNKLVGRTSTFGINPRYPFKRELMALLGKAFNALNDETKAKYFMPRMRPRRTGKPL